MTKKRDAAYYKKRLAKDHPAIFADLDAGRIKSVSAASAKAGLIKLPTRFGALKREWTGASRAIAPTPAARFNRRITVRPPGFSATSPGDGTRYPHHRRGECPQSVVSRYLISTTGIAQHHAVAATHMDAFAEIIRSHARFSSNPDLITSQRASATFQQDRVPPCQHRRMALLERSISIQHLGARHVPPCQ